MYLLLLQLLVILGLGESRQQMQQGRDKRTQHLSYAQGDQGLGALSAGADEDAQEKPDLFVAIPHQIVPELAEAPREQREMLFRFMYTSEKQKPERHLEVRDPAREAFKPRTPADAEPDGKENEKTPLQEEAQKFWHYFLFRKSSASQEVILPIKSNEVYQETCRTVPFSQTIIHDDCEKVVVQNNLCFGKCRSLRPSETTAHHHAFCSHCSPTKFTTKELLLNCTGPNPVVKVVMIVEECQCKIKQGQDREHLHSDTFTETHRQN
ncbi:cerberus [Gracilinanus agilis]|uniref:cerberus n=1 Tax=Gracilinanus agilis TaxID=191870 RepID=UPI001CFEA08D|nr:cerberus [Gracilinanus agilis]